MARKIGLLDSHAQTDSPPVSFYKKSVILSLVRRQIAFWVVKGFVAQYYADLPKTRVIERQRSDFPRPCEPLAPAELPGLKFRISKKPYELPKVYA